MSKISIIWGYFLGIAICGSSVWSPNSAFAQIIPDGTLPNNSSVKLEGNNSIILGGTQAGDNLFHSFREFSVPVNGAALFNNAANIQNIISRVTGGSVSQIDGLIRAQGSANLFLINPNGIIFGKGARLDIRGSFVATTASAIAFSNQGFFSATNPESSSSLLTVNPTALLFNQIKTASIENNSVDLSVLNGNSLLLVGGDIKMDGGRLFADGGRVELGGLASAGTVELNGNGNNLSLSFPDSVERSNVSLSNNALVYVAAGDGGSIAVNARNLEMTGESRLLAGIESGLGSNNSKAGNIEVNATGAISLDNESRIANQVRPEANGQGGDVNINANTLRVSGGAVVSADTSGAGKGGNLIVNAQDVQVIGRSADNKGSALSTSAQSNSTGDAGDLTITTNNLRVSGGAVVSAGTFGAGKGGNLTVNAQDVQIIGRSADADNNKGSTLSTSAERNSTGNAGDLSITTNTLRVSGGAVVSAGTSGAGKGGNLTVNAQDVQLVGTSADNQVASGLFASARPNSTGDAGDLTITTNTLRVSGGAQVSAGTSGAGKGGNLTVNAQDVQIIGRSADNQVASGLFASAGSNSTGNAGDLSITTNTLQVSGGAVVSAGTSGAGKGGNLTVNAQDVQIIGRSADADNEVASTLSASAQSNSTGNAGDLRIITNTLRVSGGAQLTVSNQGTGNAGRISSDAFDIRLDNQGKITAASVSGRGGDIELKTVNLMLLRHNSLISATSGVAGSAGLDGNINIGTKFLVAVPSENSDIVATGFGRTPGSNIQVNAQGIFGIQFRQQLSPESDIVATGQVTLDTPDVNPSSGLVNLPTVPVDTQVAQTCQAGGNLAKSSFTITGRGGLPPNPGEALNTDAVHVDLVSLNPKSDRSNRSFVPSKITTPAPEPIVEATGLALNEKGEVVLTANLPSTTPHSPWLKPASCKAIRNTSATLSTSS
ncbi:two-partner secretion domain-containing protein [Nostoc sp. DSM 114159]|jgi:filamentous hemagglutinin family protein